MSSEKIKGIFKGLNQAAGLLVPGVGDAIAWAALPTKNMDNQPLKRNAAIGTGLMTVATVLGYLLKNVDMSAIGIDPLAPNANILGGKAILDGKWQDDLLLFAALNILMAFAIRAVVFYHHQQDLQQSPKTAEETAAFVAFGGASIPS